MMPPQLAVLTSTLALVLVWYSIIVAPSGE